MEVFIRGVPQRETERRLDYFFKDTLTNLGIEDWTCQKIAQKPWAKLTFLSLEEGQRFLSLHGQIKDSSDRWTLSPGSVNLNFYGSPLYCSLSNRLDRFALRSLEMEKKSRTGQNTKLIISKESNSTSDDLTIACVSISCGLWDYNESDLVFKTYFTLKESATITFSSKYLVYETTTMQRLNILYYSIEAVAYEGLPFPALTFTLREAPRFFQSPDRATLAKGNDFNIMMDNFEGIFNLFERQGQDWDRLPSLNETHQKVAGKCLVYRILLAETANESNQIPKLGPYRGIPPIIRRHINIDEPKMSYATDFNLLLRRFSQNPESLTFDIKFQLQKLAQNGYLSPSKVLTLFPEVESMYLRSGKRVCANAIRKLFLQIPFAGPDAKPEYFRLQKIVSLLRNNEEISNREGLHREKVEGPEKVAQIHKAIVTPAGIYLYGPDAEGNNRVLRKYLKHHEFFLRVQFCEEDGRKVHFNPGISNKAIFERFREILNEGIQIANRHFNFLGFSHSSLRAQSCWFMAPFIYQGSLIFDRKVISDLGNFSHIRCPARCAARIGQAFSDTRDAIPIAPGVVEEIQDVKANGRVFSDGVGTISLKALELIWDGLIAGKREKPTVLQIRYQGAKGMLALDSRLDNTSIFLRPSMIKFRESNSTDLEICRAGYKPRSLYLNQQMIKILEDMGVSDDFFMNLQARAVEQLRLTTSTVEYASKFLKSHSVGDKLDLPYFIEMLSQLGLSFRNDHFLADVVEAAVLVELRALKYKARIPVKDGFTLLGIMDETGFLQEGQIFCTVDINGKATVITGKNGRKIIITRSPALHPGDIQLVTAVNVPQESPLMQLRNCICFSQKGSRDLPSMLAGGDLDGDDYHIIFDPKAQPKREFPPAEYARQAPFELDRQVEREDMTDFFLEFMETDQLGRISNAHQIIADQSDEGVLDLRCIKLAEMASTAVDFSKTGISVKDDMPKRSPWRPDFMASGPHIATLKEKPDSFDDTQLADDSIHDGEDSPAYNYYPSTKILGKLYRAIDERKVFQEVQRGNLEQSSHKRDKLLYFNGSVLRDVWRYVHHRYPAIEWRDHLDRARGIRNEYEELLFNLMLEYGPYPQFPLSEVEVFIGNILGKIGAQTTRQRELSITMKERFEMDLSLTIRYITKRASYLDNEDDEDTSSHWENSRGDQSLAMSMACLWIGVNENAEVWEYGKRGRVELRSFGYVAAAVCLKEAENFAG